MSEILFFLWCTVVQSWLIESDGIKFILMKFFTVWLGSVWYQHVAFSLMNVSIKRLLAAYFDKKKENKSIVSVFSSTYSLVTASWCSVGLARVTIFYCSYLYQFLELIHQDCLRLLRNSFFFIFKSTNSFRRQLSSRWTNLKLFSNETTLWSIFQIVEYRLTLIHKWFFDIEDHTGDHTGSVARLWPPSSSPVT